MSETERIKFKPQSPKKFNTISPRNVWHDLEFSSDEENFPKLPRRTISEQGNTWNNFKDMILGQRYLENMLIL